MKSQVNLENLQGHRYGGFRKMSVLAAACTIFALCYNGFALNPPPSGGYPQNNTALGEDALFSATMGGLENTALGYQALYSNPDNGGTVNTAVGRSALHDNTTGGGNVAVGSDSLYGNTIGSNNVAIGVNAMVAHSGSGNGSVAVGATALQAHTNSIGNTAVGFGVMSIGSTGNNNTAVGNVAMAFATGSDNTAVGDGAMNAAHGSDNIAIGRSAGLNFGGNNNIAIGQFAAQNVTTGANNIEIGNQGSSGDANKIRIGTPGTQTATCIAGIRGVSLGGVQPVGVNAQGQLGVRSSSARFKEAIKPMGERSEAILSLKPVSFRYKKELDPSGDSQFGLVAEDVAKVAPELVVRDEQGNPLSVRYEEVNAMLLNEFLKEHRTVQSLQKAMAEQQKENAAMRATLNEQAMQIREVNAQLAAIHPNDRLVTNE